MLESMRVVDLTQPVHPDTVMWPGAPAPVAETLLTIADNGFYARRVSLFEHTGTHFDAPCHFVDKGMSVDQVPADTLIRPLRVLDVSADVGDNPDAEIELDYVRRHEKEHGEIPHGAAVFVRTGWDRFCTDRARYAGEGTVPSFPGFGVAAARFLVEERAVSGLGTDTLGIDPGCATEFPVHKQVSHPRGVWHVENLVNLDQLPATGAWVFVGAIKLVDGSGAPARVLALVP